VKPIVRLAERKRIRNRNGIVQEPKAAAAALKRCVGAGIGRAAMPMPIGEHSLNGVNALDTISTLEHQFDPGNGARIKRRRRGQRLGTDTRQPGGSGRGIRPSGNTDPEQTPQGTRVAAFIDT
jgi:hypothetical protein